MKENHAGNPPPFFNFDPSISLDFLSKHLAYTFPGRLRSDIFSLIIRAFFTIAFLVYRNDHTCLPVFWCFSKISRHLTYPCQPTHFFSVQCLQHFKSDFVFTRSFSGFQFSYSYCNFCQREDFFKIIRTARVSGELPLLDSTNF